MCIATATMTAIGTALSVGGTIWQGYVNQQSANAQANAAMAQAESQARVLEYNAQQARADAAETTRQETDADRDLRYEQRAVRGSQAASVGASGSVLSSGDMTNISASTSMLQEQDLEANRKNYATQRNKYLNEAGVANWQAGLTRQGGKRQASILRSSGKNALLGSILTAGGTVASRWDDLFGG